MTVDKLKQPDVMTMTADTGSSLDLTSLSASPRVRPNGGMLPPMVSHAQNFEDVMLRRALQDIEIGSYIDIGAADPYSDSVTLWFYENGWRGINVEPDPHYFSRLAEARSEDINLQCVVGASSENVIFCVTAVGGLSTGSMRRLDAIFNDEHLVANPIVVPAITLDQLLNLRLGKEVDFLKIDVEGMEVDILCSTPFRNQRPRIIVVEATEANCQIPSHGSWEASLLGKGYIFAWFDGLNRFYVREEDKWRLSLFNVPPCYFDNFFSSTINARVGEVTVQTEQVRLAASEAERQNESLREFMEKSRCEAAERYEIELMAERAKAAEAALRQHAAEAATAETVERYEIALSAERAKAAEAALRQHAAEAATAEAAERYEEALSAERAKAEETARQRHATELATAETAERYEAALSAERANAEEAARQRQAAEVATAETAERYEAVLAAERANAEEAARQRHATEVAAAETAERNESALSAERAKAEEAARQRHAAEAAMADTAERYEAALSAAAARTVAAETRAAEAEGRRLADEALAAEQTTVLEVELRRARQDAAQAFRREHGAEMEAARHRHAAGVRTAETAERYEAALLVERTKSEEATRQRHAAEVAMADTVERYEAALSAAAARTVAAETRAAEAEGCRRTDEALAAEQMAVLEVELRRARQDAAQAFHREHSAEMEAAELLRLRRAARAEMEAAVGGREVAGPVQADKIVVVKNGGTVGRFDIFARWQLSRLQRMSGLAAQEQNWADAELGYAMMIRIRGYCLPIWVQYGHALKEQGKLNGAELAYREALAIDASDSDAHLQLGHALKLLGARDAAAEAYFEAFRLQPSYASVRIELKGAGISRSRLMEILLRPAASVTQAATRRRLNCVEGSVKLLSWWLARQAARRRDWPSAVARYRRLTARFPDVLALWEQLANALTEQGQLQEAEDAWFEVLKREPNNANLFLQLGELWELQGDKDAAFDAYVRAFRLHPALFDGREQLRTRIMDQCE